MASGVKVPGIWDFGGVAVITVFGKPGDTVAKDGSLFVPVGTPVEGRDKRRVKRIGGEK